MAFNKDKALKQADKHIAKQNFNKALTELLKVVKVTPNDVNLLNKIGDLYSKTGNTKSAIDYFTKVAESYQKGGFNLKAIALYKKIIRIDDSALDARQRLVDLYIQQGHHSEAKGELRRMAEHFFRESLFPRALACYEKLVEIEPHNLDARLKITELLIKEGKRDQAVGHFIAMGRELLAKTMVNEARKIINQGLNLDPDNEDLQVLMARTLLAEGNIEEALNRLTDICEKSHDNLDALRILGNAYLEKDMLAEAQSCFLRAFAIADEDDGQLEETATRMIAAKRLDDAFACIEPLAEACAQRGEFDEAVRLFRHILYANENHLPSLERLASIYHRNGQLANAILSLEKVINHLVDLGQNEAALKRIDALLEIDSENFEWKEKRETIARQLGGGKAAAGGPDSGLDSIHVLDDETGTSIEDLTGLEIEDSIVDDLEASGVAGALDESETSKVANHITEAEVYLKYQALDHAMTHLLEAQNLDPLNEVANTRLRDIYLQKSEIQNAILCMVRLINGAIERGDYKAAMGHVESIAEHRPDVARQHRERLAALQSDDSRHIEDDPSSTPFDMDFGADEGESLQFGQPSEQEVVDFREVKGGQDEPVPTAQGQGDDGWSLDMPDATLGEDGLGDDGIGSDLRELYNPAEATISEGADAIPDLDAIRAGFQSAADDSDRDSGDAPSANDDSVNSTEDYTEQLSEGTVPPTPEVEIEPPASDVLDFPEGAGDFEIPEETETEAEALDDSLLMDASDLEAVSESASEPVEEVTDGSAEMLDEADLLEEEEQPDPTEKTGYGLLDLDEPAATEPDSAEAPAEPPPQPSSDPVHAPLESSQGSLAGELEEIDFFISVEAFDDAANLIAEARKHFGDHPLLLEREQEVAAKTQAPPDTRKPTFTSSPTPQPAAEGEADSLLSNTDGNGFFDLAASLSEELFDDESQIDVNDKTSKEEIQSVEELFEEFKKGVDEQIDSSDTETHYDLGIAYKEMGLLEEAIAEFEIANQDEGRLIDCATMIGHCLIELGRVEKAIEHYETVLGKVTAPHEKVAVEYELALLYQDTGNVEKALDLLLRIKETSPDYRDLEELIEALAI